MARKASQSTKRAPKPKRAPTAKSAQGSKDNSTPSAKPSTRGKHSARVAGLRSSGNDIHAVANTAGVSISTVSRFLNAKKRLSPATEARIQAAVVELGYAPNRVAQSLRQGRTNTVGLILPDSSNPFFSGLVKGAEDTLRAAGFALVLFNSSEDRERENAHLRTLIALRCDGALVIPAPQAPHEGERWRLLGNVPFPVVFVDRKPTVDHDLVVVDNENGGFETGRYLVELGHKRIAILLPDYSVSSQTERLAGFRRALQAASIDLPDDFVIEVPPSVQDGFSAATRLLQSHAPPTAIFATSSRLAIGTVAAIKARGLGCPGDVSVVGYDSYEWQDVFEPRLTTICQPASLLGQRSASMLLQRMAAKKPFVPQKVVLRAELQVRGSCQPPRGLDAKGC